MDWLRIKNWDRFQHYKDRNPPWIKLHVEIFQSEEWAMAPTNDERLLMVVMMVLAARHDNKILDNRTFIKKVAFLDKEPNIEWLLECGFLEPWTEEKAWESPWPSRHISEAVKGEVWERDKGRCTACAATKNIEYDHIIPVSKGGIGLRDNVQLLCRSCNRKKRNKMTAAAQCVATATQDKSLRSLETETETYREETEKERYIRQFDEFWSLAPRKRGKGQARKAFKAALKKTNFETLNVGIVRYAREVAGKDDEFIAHPATWLNGERWLDEPEREPHAKHRGNGKPSAHDTMLAAHAFAATSRPDTRDDTHNGQPGERGKGDAGKPAARVPRLPSARRAD